MLKKFHEAALDEIYVPGSNEEVFSGRLLKVQRDHVTLPNGNDTTREYIRHPVENGSSPHWRAYFE